MHPLRPTTATFDPWNRELHLEVRTPARRCYTLRLSARGLRSALLSDGRLREVVPPEIDFSASGVPVPVGQALNRFWTALPQDIQDAALPFVWRRLPLVQILTASGHARDLMANTPLLVWLLADRLGHGLTLEQALSLVRARQALILETLLEEHVQGGIKFLRKARARSYDRDVCTTLKTTLRDPECIAALRHNRSVSLDAVRIILDAPESLSIPLVRRELDKGDVSPHRVWMLRMGLKACLKYKSELPEADYNNLLEHCRSLHDLHHRMTQLCDRFNTRLNAFSASLNMEKELGGKLQNRTASWEATLSRTITTARMRRSRKQAKKKRRPEPGGPYPQQPLSGNQWIRPIETPQELMEERDVMDNCLHWSTYARKIQNGQCYIYRVYFPERCTLEIALSDNGQWRLQELKAKSNRSPRPETIAFVRAWIEKANTPITRAHWL